MGTRGFVGFVVDGQEKITYNHWDSYPGGLGMEVLTWLRSILDSGMEWKSYVRNLRMVSEASRPGSEEIERLQQYAVTNVGEQRIDDWYCLLRNTQGDPGAILAAGYAIDSGDFPTDSLFAEWGYIVDTDTDTLEVYEGFQRQPHNLGRFAHRAPKEINLGPGRQYYPVALRAAWSFNALPTGEDFLGVLTDLSEGD